MNSPQCKRDAAGARRFGAVSTLLPFVEMAVEGWRKLLADMAYAFARKGSYPDVAVIEEKRFGEQ